MVVLKFHYLDEIRRVTVDKDFLSYAELKELAKSLFTALPESISFKYKDDEGDSITVSSEKELEEAFRIAKKQNLLRVFIVEVAGKSKSSGKDEKEKETSFFDVLEKLVSENPFVRNLLNNLEIEIKSIPDELKDLKDVIPGLFNQTQEKESKQEVPKPMELKYVHNAICDSCDSQIKGIRYKCQQCPDYDLCETCEPNKQTVHKDHTFTAIKFPSCRRGAGAGTFPVCFPHQQPHHPHPNMNANPHQNQTPFGQGLGRCPFRGRRFDNNNDANVPQSEVVHPAVCDGCKARVKGIRYKCETCPDFDLCESCNAKNIHSEHKFKQILRTPMNRFHPRQHPHHPHPHVAFNVSGPTPYTQPEFGVDINIQPTEQPINIPVTTSTDDINIGTKVTPITTTTTSAPTTPVVEKKVEIEVEQKQPKSEKKPKEPKEPKKPKAEKKQKPEKTDQQKKVKPERPIKVQVPVTVTESVPVVALETQPQVEEPKTVVLEQQVQPQVPVVENANSNSNSNASPSPSPFELKLRQLEEMGFLNKQKNIELLVKTKGDMLETVKQLLEN